MIDTSRRGWKKKATEHCRKILNEAAIGSRLSDCDCEWLKQVLDLHQEASRKIGCGVHYFEVRKNGYGGRGFWIIRNDGTVTDFSFVKCISPGHAMADFAKACRTAVADDIIAFKNSVFDGKEHAICPVSGELIFRDSCHIDHAPPSTFDVLVASFAKMHNDPAGCVRPTHDGETVTRFECEDVAQQFRKFHAENAVLRAVSKYANLSTLRKRES
jgi:hypothetical protein